MTSTPNYARPTAFDIIRSLDKRLAAFKHVGWIYVLRNPAFRESLFKIGKSRRPPMLRAYELGAATSVPEGFQLIYFVHVSDRHRAESQVHAWLANYRKVPGKEFFTAPLTQALDALDRVAGLYPIVIGRRHGSSALPQFLSIVTVKCSTCGLENRVRQLAIGVQVKCGGCSTGLGV